ncbi:CPBP family intramembrane metalloprotease [Candidatus Kaiserbacteria bacterium]|nr:CPBP family intramembrane metalloprotease [Candidatus Kaiserbacteria bacterium]
MIDRIYAFTPSMLGVFVVGTASYLWYLKRRTSFHNRSDRLNNWRHVLAQFSVVGVLAAPCIEELLFRAPLAILYTELNASAWLAIVQLAVIFSTWHLNVTHSFLFRELPATNRILLQRKIVYLSTVGLLGLCLGYVAVRYQSLLAPVMLHMSWNIFAVIVMSRVAIMQKRALEALGCDLAEVPAHAVFILHLQETRQQGVFESSAFEGGDAFAIGKVFSMHNDNRGTIRHFKVYKIKQTPEGAFNVFASECH